MPSNRQRLSLRYQPHPTKQLLAFAITSRKTRSCVVVVLRVGAHRAPSVLANDRLAGQRVALLTHSPTRRVHRIGVFGAGKVDVGKLAQRSCRKLTTHVNHALRTSRFSETRLTTGSAHAVLVTLLSQSPARMSFVSYARTEDSVHAYEARCLPTKGVTLMHTRTIGAGLLLPLLVFAGASCNHETSVTPAKDTFHYPGPTLTRPA